MPKRNPVQRERDLAETARRLCQGEHQYEIAASLGVSSVQVCKDVKTLQRRWKESGIRDTEADKAQELARIDNLERTYWEAWERSKGERQVTETSRLGADGQGQGGTTRAGVKREQRDGDPRFLQGVQWCIERRCALLGLDEPVMVDITTRVLETAQAQDLEPAEAVELVKAYLATERLKRAR